MSWFADAAELLTGGRHDHCEAEHGEHATLSTFVTVGGRPMQIDVFDWPRYADTPGYCPGDDDVSKSVCVNKVHERNESELVSTLLDGHRGEIVIDFGAHIGWFSMLAERAGCPVLSVDADTEHLRVLHTNALRNGAPTLVTPVRGWIGPESPPLPLPFNRVRLVKIDIEGNEHEAVRVIEPLLLMGAIDYVLMEVSPVFRDTYADTLERVMSYGYSAAVVEDELLPLPSPDVAPFLDSIDQASVILRREGAG